MTVPYLLVSLLLAVGGCGASEPAAPRPAAPVASSAPGEAEAESSHPSGSATEPSAPALDAQSIEMAWEGAPSPRGDHTAIWTGRHLIVWGGDDGLPTEDTGYAPVAPHPLNSGGAYDPSTKSWVPLSQARAPAPREGHTAVWTGSQMLIWGGLIGTTIDPDGPSRALASGAVYDPAQDRWYPVSPRRAPSARGAHTAVWTGAEMIVWGGASPSGVLGDGARYSRLSDGWVALPADAVPSPRRAHTAIWTGTDMIIWGGRGPRGELGDGARYELATHRWVPLAADGAPSPREGHVAVWTGTEMVVWGGQTAGAWLNTGARYDPAQNQWRPLSTEVPILENPQAFWSGSLLAIVGEEPASGERDTPLLQLYDPAADRWTGWGMYSPNDHSVTWAGSSIFTWGGFDGTNLMNQGSMIPFPPVER